MGFLLKAVFGLVEGMGYCPPSFRMGAECPGVRFGKVGEQEEGGEAEGWSLVERSRAADAGLLRKAVAESKGA